MRPPLLRPRPRHRSRRPLRRSRLSPARSGRRLGRGERLAAQHALQPLDARPQLGVVGARPMRRVEFEPRPPKQSANVLAGLIALLVVRTTLPRTSLHLVSLRLLALAR